MRRMSNLDRCTLIYTYTLSFGSRVALAEAVALPPRSPARPPAPRAAKLDKKIGTKYTLYKLPLTQNSFSHGPVSDLNRFTRCF